MRHAWRALNIVISNYIVTLWAVVSNFCKEGFGKLDIARILIKSAVTTSFVQSQSRQPQYFSVSIRLNILIVSDTEM